MTVAIVDSGSGNLRSVAKAFERAGASAVSVTRDPETVAAAERIVLPGQGAFARCRAGIDGVDGLREALEQAVIARRRPFLGICVGMQLMATAGEEHGEHSGFDWLPGRVAPLTPSDPALKVPHMGWNRLTFARPHPVLDGLGAAPYVYFANSFQMRCDEAGHVLATVEYGGAMTAAVGRDNLVGVQFHPEKSQATGLALLANFLAWRP